MSNTKRIEALKSAEVFWANLISKMENNPEVFTQAEITKAREMLAGVKDSISYWASMETKTCPV